MSNAYALTKALPRVYGEPTSKAVLRREPVDFQVEENLGYEPEGQGEHVYLWVEKTGLNTQFVADRIAAFAEQPKRNVSFSGMKDRHAVTRQWFGVHMPGKAELDWPALNDSQLTIHKAIRHPRKLRRGSHRENYFSLRLTAVEGDKAEVERRLQAIKSGGFPNYFGEQRFGHEGRNTEQAERWFAGQFKPKRQQQSIYLSAARSWLFNQVLAERVRDKSWDQLLAGELLMLNGTHSVFTADDDSSLNKRLQQGDIHPTGPMYGKAGKLACGEDVAALEQRVLGSFPALTQGLENKGLRAERRALRVIPGELVWQWEDDQLKLDFFLPSGCFATALVRELVRVC